MCFSNFSTKILLGFIPSSKEVLIEWQNKKKCGISKLEWIKLQCCTFRLCNFATLTNCWQTVNDQVSKRKSSVLVLTLSKLEQFISLLSDTHLNVQAEAYFLWSVANVSTSCVNVGGQMQFSKDSGGSSHYWTADTRATKKSRRLGEIP